MHAHQCGEQFEGLCTEMMSIDGETLLRFLRNVTFEGKTNVPFFFREIEILSSK